MRLFRPGRRDKALAAQVNAIWTFEQKEHAGAVSAYADVLTALVKIEAGIKP